MIVNLRGESVGGGEEVAKMIHSTARLFAEGLKGGNLPTGYFSLILPYNLLAKHISHCLTEYGDIGKERLCLALI